MIFYSISKVSGISSSRKLPSWLDAKTAREDDETAPQNSEAVVKSPKSAKLPDVPSATYCIVVRFPGLLVNVPPPTIALGVVGLTLLLASLGAE
jgi:hypothetical protein